MDRDTAYETVRRYSTKQLGVAAGEGQAGRAALHGSEPDSIDALDMISLMETELGMVVVEEELKAIRTVEDVAQYLVRYAPQKK